MWGIFVNFFSNIFNLVIVLIFLLLGMILGVLLRPRWGNSVMKIMPKDRRFVDFAIDEETAISVTCSDKKGYPPQRFLKLREGFMGQIGRFVKRTVTRYIGKEGTAYTWKSEQGKFTKIPGGLPSALKVLWGETEYSNMPENLRQKLEENKILVTVDLADGLTPGDMQSVSEEDIKREQDRKACETLWEGKRKEERGVWLDKVIIGLAGFGVAVTLQVLGILTIPTVQPAPPAGG